MIIIIGNSASGSPLKSLHSFADFWAPQLERNPNVTVQFKSIPHVSWDPQAESDPNTAQSFTACAQAASAAVEGTAGRQGWLQLH